MTKGSKIQIQNEVFECYNVTSVVHFIKVGKQGQPLSLKNGANFMNLTNAQIERFSKLGSITIL
jgi:hypothetical protein